MDIIEKMYDAVTWMLHLPFTWFLDDETTEQQPEQQPETDGCIRIIQHGKERAWRRFTCKACGCVYESCGDGYTIENVCRLNEDGRFEIKTIALATCPECNANVTEEITNDIP